MWGLPISHSVCLPSLLKLHSLSLSLPSTDEAVLLHGPLQGLGTLHSPEKLQLSQCLRLCFGQAATTTPHLSPLHISNPAMEPSPSTVSSVPQCPGSREQAPPGSMDTHQLSPLPFSCVSQLHLRGVPGHPCLPQ